MACLRDNSGRVIGAVDAPGRGSTMLRTCKRTAADRMALGCEPRRRLGRDEALIDADTGDLIDSAQARRIIEAVMKKLDKDDLSFVVDMLVTAEKMTKEEQRNLASALDPMPSNAALDRKPSRPTWTAADQWARQAADARVFPHADRLKR